MFRRISRLNLRGLVLFAVGLIVVLGGTAIAAGALTKSEKQQVKTIAKNTFNSNIGGASVKQASDSDRLGGDPPSAYQRALKGDCPGQAIETIAQDGEVTCLSPVQAVEMVPPASPPDNVVTQDLRHGLLLTTYCNLPGPVSLIVFGNDSPSPASLNWFYSDGSTVSASGVTVAGGGQKSFSFEGARIEGQFIYQVGGVVITVNLHAFDGTTFCEVTGTAETGT